MSTRREFLRKVSATGGLLTISQIPFNGQADAEEVAEATKGLFGEISRKTDENAGEILRLKVIVGPNDAVHPMSQQEQIECSQNPGALRVADSLSCTWSRATGWVIRGENWTMPLGSSNPLVRIELDAGPAGNNADG